MPVVTDITQLSTTAASNYPAGTENANTVDDYIRQQSAFIAQLRDELWTDMGDRGFWPDVSASATIFRFRDRVFVGEGAAALGSQAVQDQNTDWMATDAAGASWAIRSSQLLCMSSIGSMSITGASRSGSRAGAGLSAAGATIGVSGVVINDVASGTAWGLYSDVQHETGRWSTGLEVAAKNKGANVTPGPYGTGDTVHGIWLAGGGDSAYGGSPTNPSGSGIVLIKNAHTWNRGIVFAADAITGTDGVTGTGTAISMARGHIVEWQFAGANTGATIRSDVDTSGQNVSQLFGNNSVLFRGANNKPSFAITITSNAANYVSVVSATTGNPPYLAAAGDDTDVDLKLTPKGTGVVQFGTHSALVAETVSGYITIKDAAGNSRKLAVVS